MGFEPMNIKKYNSLANYPFKPLRHSSFFFKI
jgi:hypothetical protein